MITGKPKVEEEVVETPKPKKRKKSSDEKDK